MTLFDRFFNTPLRAALESYLGLLAPVLYFSYRSFSRKSLVFPYLKIFLAVTILFIFFESPLFRDNQESNYVYAYYLFIIYTIFFTIVNFGQSKEHYQVVVRYSFGLLFFLTWTQYLIFLGFFGEISIQDNSQMGNYSEGNSIVESIRYGEMIDALIHPNGASILAAFAILMVVISSNKNITLFKVKNVFPLIFLFFPLIFLNATRGAFIVIFTILGLFYVFTFKRSSSTKVKLFMIIIPMMVVISFLILLQPQIEKLLLLNRLIETDTTAARYRQISLSLNNFINNPFLGVGFHYATLGGEYTRSNFSYSQILASHGVVYFLLYMVFIFRMWPLRFKNEIIIYCSIFALGHQAIYNWAILQSLPILAYIIYLEKNNETTS